MSQQIDTKYITKLNQSIQIIKDNVINNAENLEFISSITNQYTSDKITVIRNINTELEGDSLGIKMPTNKQDIRNIMDIRDAIIDITTLVQLLSTFDNYTPGKPLRDDITFERVNVTEITRIPQLLERVNVTEITRIPRLLFNKQQIIKKLYNIYNVYDKSEYDIPFYDELIDREKVKNLHSMSAGSKITKYKRIRRTLKRKRRSLRRRRRSLGIKKNRCY